MPGFPMTRARPFPLAVVRAGAYVAWATRYTAGVPAGTSLSPASGISGTGVTKSAPNISISGNTNSFSAIDFYDWSFYAYGGAVVTVSSSSFMSGPTNGPTGFGMINQGQDASISAAGPSNLTLSKCTVSGVNYRNGSNQLHNMSDTSSFTATDTRFVRAPVDFIKTGGLTTISLTRCYMTTMCCYDAPPDHGEMIQHFGVSATFTDTLFDQSALGPISRGVANVMLYFDPAAGTNQIVLIERCIILHDDAIDNIIQLGGLGTVTCIVRSNVLQIGAGGHYISGLAAAGVTFIDGGNNYDYATGNLITVF